MVEYEGDVSPSKEKVAQAQAVKRGRKSLFTRGRLRSLSRRMVAEYMDTLIGLTGRATKQAMGKLPLKRELTCFSRSMAEASKRALKADVDMVTKENQSLEEKSVELEAALKKEREERRKADNKVKTLNSRVNKFVQTKMKLDTEIDKWKRESEKLQKELDEALLALTQVNA
ncbi:hypothetical protein Dimus_020760 [Dionaea muscipula]